ncbi:hypothetical protein M758_10G100600 [Ceratodon purpureus]|uniref:Uncharacterized protein n=1 Tax=Ceratodon purpureus TaxID=3225 RepID=A0A8T0GMH7_CERPU|nr:hypothetical protein KC19_10G103500 [Ceratodon purpureus]KAG0603534.1 hypothetical protein M758_10G100600 [Ceratodon purpureus]
MQGHGSSSLLLVSLEGVYTCVAIGYSKLSVEGRTGDNCNLFSTRGSKTSPLFMRCVLGSVVAGREYYRVVFDRFNRTYMSTYYVCFVSFDTVAKSQNRTSKVIVQYGLPVGSSLSKSR